MRLATSCILLAMCVLVGGCYPYVNIPAQPGDQALHSVNDANVRKASVAAITAVLKERPVTGMYTIMLPRGADYATYQRTMAELELLNIGIPTLEVADNIPIIEVRELRIRGDKAEVDVVKPYDYGDARGLGQLITVDLRWDVIVGWMTVRQHAWRTPVNIVEPIEVTPVLMPQQQSQPLPEDAAERVEEDAVPEIPAALEPEEGARDDVPVEADMVPEDANK